MYPIERRNMIVELLKQKKSISVSELANQLFIGEATIRRDLEKLEKQNILKRTHGGAVLSEGLSLEIPLSVREKDHKIEKNIIGEFAASLVNDGDTIILDSSSTTLSMVNYLKNKKGLTVITNGAKTAVVLGELLHTKVYCTGGVLRENSLSFIGYQARQFLENFHADKVFFSCRSISMELGLTDANEDEAELRRIMIKNSHKAILLCDHTKFDNNSFCLINRFEGIESIITDLKPNQQLIDFFNKKNIILYY